MHIGIAGNIGSGKTTLTRLLSEYYGWTPKYEAITHNPYIEDYYRDIHRWSFNLEVYFLTRRFKDIIEKRAMDIIQPDLCCCGGITEVMRISALAEVSGTTLMMHVWGSAVGLFAALNVMAALPPAPHSWKPAPVWMEYEQTESPFREKLVNEPVRRENGVVKIPSGPGLGFTINEEIINKYRVK